jgi:phosphatidate cytidylyltransferase
MVRLATAAVLAPLLWLLIREAPPALFIALGLAVVGLCCWETYRMLERRGVRPFTWIGVLAGVAVAVTFVDADRLAAPAWPLTALALGTTVGALWRRDEPAEMLDTALATVFPVLLVGLSLAHVVGLRSIPGEDGKDLLLLLFLCVIMSDTAAYYVGSRWGRRRLAPRLSPRKSWEGAAGGLGASVLSAVVAQQWFYQRLTPVHALALGVVLGVTAILGDLSESMLKRATGVKDSSELLPGHGGMLDRLDSLLVAGPVLYHYYHLFLRDPA